MSKKKKRPELEKALAYSKKTDPPKETRNHLGGRRWTKTML